MKNITTDFCPQCDSVKRNKTVKGYTLNQLVNEDSVLFRTRKSLEQPFSCLLTVLHLLGVTNDQLHWRQYQVRLYGGQTTEINPFRCHNDAT